MRAQKLKLFKKKKTKINEEPIKVKTLTEMENSIHDPEEIDHKNKRLKQIDHKPQQRQIM